MAKIVSFYSGDILKTLASRKIHVKKNGDNALVTVTFDIIKPAFMGDDGSHSADGDQIVMSMDSMNISKESPEISFTSQDKTDIYLNISWKLVGKKVNHGSLFATKKKRSRK